MSELDDNNREISKLNQTVSIENATKSKGNGSVLDFNWVVGGGGGGDENFLGVNNSERY